VRKATESYKTPKVKIPMDRSLGNKSQTMDSSSKRHLDRLRNSNSDSKIELV